MHQHPRPPPLTASPASSPQTNPTRTNNSREEEDGYTRRNKGQDVFVQDGNDERGGKNATSPPPGISKDVLRKIDQIVQNFHTKAAILVLQSRISLPIITQEGIKKVNKWFQIETDDTNSFRQELSIWRHCGSYSDRPPPLIIETYIDLSELTKSQSLVIVDDLGKRWDVLEALNRSSDGSAQLSRRNTEVILERWKFELKDLRCEEVYDFGSTLPTVYKKLIVFFRSLYATTKFIPTGRFVRTLTKRGSVDAPIKVNCRILNGQVPINCFDALKHPIFENGNIPVTIDFVLGITETPVGQAYAEVSYRQDCNFRIDDSETLLSSRFMGADEYFFQPSLGLEGFSRHTSKSTEIESESSGIQRIFDQDPVNNYEELSTSHSEGPSRGSSPIYAHRPTRTLSSELEPSPAETQPNPRPSHVSRSSINSIESNNMARRPSVSFQPFKAGPLSSSPGHTKPIRGEVTAPQSSPRISGVSTVAQVRSRSSLTAGTPATLRGGPAATEHGNVLPTPSSPKPGHTSRYSSSFTRRRGHSTYSTTSRSVADDDQSSSGKQSLSSSIQPSPILLAEIGSGGASGSLQTDGDNISEFLKVLDRQKTLKSFETSGETAAKRTSAQLSKYQSLRESHNALTESMTSSTFLNRSSSSSV